MTKENLIKARAVLADKREEQSGLKKERLKELEEEIAPLQSRIESIDKRLREFKKMLNKELEANDALYDQEQIDSLKESIKKLSEEQLDLALIVNEAKAIAKKETKALVATVKKPTKQYAAVEPKAEDDDDEWEDEKPSPNAELTKQLLVLQYRIMHEEHLVRHYTEDLARRAADLKAVQVELSICDDDLRKIPGDNLVIGRRERALSKESRVRDDVASITLKHEASVKKLETSRAREKQIYAIVEARRNE